MAMPLPGERKQSTMGGVYLSGRRRSNPLCGGWAYLNGRRTSNPLGGWAGSGPTSMALTSGFQLLQMLLPSILLFGGMREAAVQGCQRRDPGSGLHAG